MMIRTHVVSAINNYLFFYQQKTESCQNTGKKNKRENIPSNQILNTDHCVLEVRTPYI